MRRLIGPTPMNRGLLPEPAPSPLARIRRLRAPWLLPSSGGRQECRSPGPAVVLSMTFPATPTTARPFSGQSRTGSPAAPLGPPFLRSRPVPAPKSLPSSGGQWEALLPKMTVHIPMLLMGSGMPRLLPGRKSTLWSPVKTVSSLRTRLARERLLFCISTERLRVRLRPAVRLRAMLAAGVQKSR